MKGRIEQLKRNIGKFHKGGVIVDVKNCDEAKKAEQSGVVAVRVMELQVTSYYESSHNHLALIENILKETSISVIAKIRTGHYMEARILEQLGVHFIEESEAFGVVDQIPIAKNKFRTPFISNYHDFHDGIKKFAEGASMICTAGGNLNNTVQSLRNVQHHLQKIIHLDEEHLFIESVNLGLPFHILKQIKAYGRLPIAQFAFGGIKTPADAALVMKLGADGIILGNEIFSLSKPINSLQIFVETIIDYEDYSRLTSRCIDFQNIAIEEETSFVLESSLDLEAELR